MAGLDSPDTIFINVSFDLTHYRTQSFTLVWFGLLNLKVFVYCIMYFVPRMGIEPIRTFLPKGF